MSAHVLLKLLNELGKKDKMRGFNQRFYLRQHVNQENVNIIIYHMTSLLFSG